MRLRRLMAGGPPSSSTAKDLSPSWKYEEAAEYMHQLTMAFGPPSYASKDEAGWMEVAGFSNVWVRDEKIPHKFPKKHYDFVYATKRIPGLKPKHIATAAFVSGSIMCDGLKQEVHARCGTLYANATTIGFMEDLVSGKIKTDPKSAKAEYARRIKGGWLPKWYRNELDE